MKKLGNYLIYSFFIIIMAACKKENLQMKVEQAFEEPGEGMMKLGKKLENPYSVENMRKALKSLNERNVRSSSAKISTSDIEVVTTHLYIRFVPKNEDELAILKRDSSLVLYDHPLDYEIKENGVFYRDPEAPAGQPTYQYGAVPVDQKLPEGVAYDLLSELYIPDEDRDEDASGLSGKNSVAANTQVSSDAIDALVDEALRITNNLPGEKNISKKNPVVLKSKWRPAGTIRVMDNVLNRWVGVEGVEVRARRWFTTYKGFANADGYYSCDGRFRRDANYSIDWERYNFALRDGWLNGATYNGPKIRGDWNLSLEDDEQAYYATIFRAAFHYYYQDIKGLRRPPENGVLKTQMKIRAYLQNGNDGNLGTYNNFWRLFGLGDPLKIYTYGRPSSATYGTVIHELAHASHWNMSSGGDYTNSDDQVAESWARGVQWELTRMVYPNFNVSYFSVYRGVVQDMIDGDNRFGNDNIFGEAVSGYTIRQIEDALRGQRSWTAWRDNILNTYNNETENNLEALFAYWN